MNFILVAVLFICLSLAISEFKKAKSMDGFDLLIKGIVKSVSSSKEGVFFSIEYPGYNGDRGFYRHCFNKEKLEKHSVNYLVQKFTNSSFYLIGKVEGEKIIEVKPYSNSKVTRWLYLLGMLVTGYFLLN
jgi:hypothetical protein